MTSVNPANQFFRVTGDLQIQSPSLYNSSNALISFRGDFNTKLGQIRAFGFGGGITLLLDSSECYGGLCIRSNAAQGDAYFLSGQGDQYAFECTREGLTTIKRLDVALKATAYAQEFDGNSIFRVNKQNTILTSSLTNALADFTINSMRANEHLQILVGNNTFSGCAVYGYQMGNTTTASSNLNTSYLGMKSNNVLNTNIRMYTNGDVDINGTLKVGILDAGTVTPASVLPLTLDKVNGYVGINNTFPTDALSVIGTVNLMGATKIETGLQVVNGSIDMIVTNAGPLGEYKIDGISVLSNSTLGTNIINSSLTSVGTLNSLGVLNNINIGGEYTVNNLRALRLAANGAIAIGNQAASLGTAQGGNAVAIGYRAGKMSQSNYAVGIGQQAGETSQAANSVAVGYQSGAATQGTNSVAIGYQAGNATQGTSCVAVGNQAGKTSQAINGIAVGSNAASTSQSTNAVAIGNSAGNDTQGSNAVAVGNTAGQTTQGNNAVAVGAGSGQTSQSSNTVAVGYTAGNNTQGTNAVAVGNAAGNNTQGNNAVAIGAGSGQTSQSSNTVAVGYSAGNSTQGTNAVAIGNVAGQISQGTNTVAVGVNAGTTNQASGAVAIGRLAGTSTQGAYAVAIGEEAGKTSQTTNAVAIGHFAGFNLQGNIATAVGMYSGTESQGQYATAIGNSAGRTTQGSLAVAIGSNAGLNSQGTYSIAIGSNAGLTNQHANSIILYAGGATGLNSDGASRFYVNPVRNTTSGDNLCTYNTSTSEISYTQALSSLSVSGNITLGSIIIATGTGSPETVVTASPGSMYLNSSGGAGTSLYIKESGTGNTGWIAK